MRPIVFIDCETTGLGPDREAWEIAMIKRTGRGPEAELSFFVGVTDLSKADPMSLKFSKFYERHSWYAPKDTISDSQVYEESLAAHVVEEWTRNVIIVGNVPNFDTEVLDKLLRRHGKIPAWHYHLVDVEQRAVGWLAAQGQYPGEDWKSDGLSRMCGVEPPADDERHTALGDARWALKWFDATSKPPTPKLYPANVVDLA